jgi:hypothetical protein
MKCIGCIHVIHGVMPWIGMCIQWNSLAARHGPPPARRRGRRRAAAAEGAGAAGPIRSGRAA